MLPLCQNGEYWRADKRRQDRENRRCGRLGPTVSTTEIPGRAAIFQHMAHTIWRPNRPRAHSAFFRDLCPFFATCDEHGGTTPLVSPRHGGLRRVSGWDTGVRTVALVIRTVMSKGGRPPLYPPDGVGCVGGLGWDTECGAFGLHCSHVELLVERGALASPRGPRLSCQALTMGGSAHILWWFTTSTP
jgi:hypothetical protein